MKHSLTATGLSLSTAQSVSNLCNQRAIEITAFLTGVNNAGKNVNISGQVYDIVVAKPIPPNVIELLANKSKLHACQAFLMENIKAKDALIKGLQRLPFLYHVEPPVQPTLKRYQAIPLVDEEWGNDQLTVDEICKKIEAEAYAAHIGQFIHEKGQLTILRSELPKVKTVEFMTIKDGEKTPVRVVPHHTSVQLLKIHEELAELHRGYEQTVNYFKAKVKNLVTTENARIANENAVESGKIDSENQAVTEKYIEEMRVWRTERDKAHFEFEAQRQKDIKKIAALRIEVDPRFQEVINEFLKLTGGEDSEK